MTRSVEIPEQAVEDSCEASEGYWGPALPAATRAMVRDRNRRIIAAALPYLAPAKVCPCRTVALSGWDRVMDVTDPGCVIHGQAAAVDGGLRKALTGKPFCQTHESRRLGCPYCDADQMALDLLARHPAAPAVLQPADEGALAKDVDYWKERAIRAECIVAQPAAVPQPVDREALRGDILQALTEVYESGAMGGEWPTLGTDAVLAVLAGEQEQVEK